MRLGDDAATVAKEQHRAVPPEQQYVVRACDRRREVERASGSIGEIRSHRRMVRNLVCADGVARALDRDSAGVVSIFHAVSAMPARSYTAHAAPCLRRYR